MGVLREVFKPMISKAVPIAAAANRPVFPASKMLPILPKTAIARKQTPATTSKMAIGTDKMILIISFVPRRKITQNATKKDNNCRFIDAIQNQFLIELFFSGFQKSLLKLIPSKTFSDFLP